MDQGFKAYVKSEIYYLAKYGRKISVLKAKFQSKKVQFSSL